METKNIVRVEDKQDCYVDILIDDYEKNLIGGKYEKILITKYWNKHVDTKSFGIRRANNFDEVLWHIKKIAELKA